MSDIAPEGDYNRSIADGREGIVMEGKSTCYFLISSGATIGSKVIMKIALPESLGVKHSTIVCEGTIVSVNKTQNGKKGIACSVDELNLKSV